MSYARLHLLMVIVNILEHAHQFVSVNMAVSSCQVVFFWFLVSGMAIIKKRFFCCAIVLRGIRTSVLLFVCVFVIFNS